MPDIVLVPPASSTCVSADNIKREKRDYKVIPAHAVDLFVECFNVLCVFEVHPSDAKVLQSQIDIALVVSGWVS